MKHLIQFETHYWELETFIRVTRDYPPGGREVASLLAQSIIEELKPSIIRKAETLRSNPNVKSRTRTIKLKWWNHQARSVALYLSMLISGDHIIDDHDRTNIDFMRSKLLKQLA